MYAGQMQVCAVRWAKSVGAAVWVLSAKYGLIPGSQVIAPYSASFANTEQSSGYASRDTGPKEAPVALAVIRWQVIEATSVRGLVPLLAGEVYERVLTAAAGDMVRPHNPFKAAARARWHDARNGWQTKVMNESAGRMPCTGACVLDARATAR